MLRHLLTWLDASPARYHGAAWISFAVVGGLALAAWFAPDRRTGWRHPAWFAAALLLALLAFRWPTLLHNQQLGDPDESQLMAGALTLGHDPRFWQSVDGTTHGPFATLPLLIPMWLGATLDFTTARSVSVLLCWATVVAAWAAFRRIFPEGFARVLVLPLFAGYAFLPNGAFVAYCSEHAPEALVAAGCALLMCAWDPAGAAPRRGRLFLAGLALGAVPFAKLQSVPTALWVALAGGAVALGMRGQPWREQARAGGALVAGGLTVPALILGWVAASGLWPDFWQSYIRNNLAYAGARWFTWAETPARFIELVRIAGEFTTWFFWLAGASLCGLLALPWLQPAHRRWVAFGAGLFAAALYATMAPGKMFPHYLQLMMFATGLFGGLVAGSLLSRVSGLARLGVLGLWLAMTLGPQLRWRTTLGQDFAGEFRVRQGQLVQSEVAREILRDARPGEAMAIWGWMPTFWVETGLIQGTREGNAVRQIDPSPDRDYYRARFLADLQRTRARVFVDAVGGDNFTYHDRAAAAHETFPALRDHVAAHYELRGDVAGTRIYIRRDPP
jgi:hypothetical protein